jgi:hypothetical protein
VSGIASDKQNRSNRHWTVDRVSGELIGAYTNWDGRLVLSDYTCEFREPPCEPDSKTGLCPDEPAPKWRRAARAGERSAAASPRSSIAGARGA